MLASTANCTKMATITEWQVLMVTAQASCNDLSTISEMWLTASLTDHISTANMVVGIGKACAASSGHLIAHAITIIFKTVGTTSMWCNIQEHRCLISDDTHCVMGMLLLPIASAE